MRYRKKILVLAVLLMLTLLGLIACDSGGGMSNGDPPEPPTTDSVTVSAEATNNAGTRIDSAAIKFDDTQVGTGYAEKTYQKNADKTLEVEANGKNLVSADTSVGLDSDHNLELLLREEAKDNVTIAAEAINDSGTRIDTAAIFFDGTQVGTGYAEEVFSKIPDRELSVKSGGDGLTEADTSVGLGSSHNLQLTLREKIPDEATLTFSNTTADADSSAAGSWTWKGEQIASGVASGTHTVPGSDESGDLCFEEGEFFLRQCAEITPDTDRTVELVVERKQVTVSVTPVDSTNTVRSEAVTKMYEPNKADSLAIDGEGSVELAKRSGKRTLFSDLITEEPNTSKLDRFQSNLREFPADADRSITTELVKLPACSDDIDNDGDNYADKADTRACTDLNGNYDPQDDNEVLIAFSRATGVFFDDSTFVSSKSGQRVAEITKLNPLPQSAVAAKGEVEFLIEVKASPDTSGEDFAIHIKAGASNDNFTRSDTSAIVPDADTLDGWSTRRAYGIHGAVFRDGPYYGVYAWDDSKALGQPPGEDDVRVYFYAEQEDYRAHTITYVYEPEDVPDKNRKSAYSRSGVQATLKSGQCRQVSATDEVCRVPAGKVNKF